MPAIYALKFCLCLDDIKLLAQLIQLSVVDLNTKVSGVKQQRVYLREFYLRELEKRAETIRKALPPAHGGLCHGSKCTSLSCPLLLKSTQVVGAARFRP